MAAPKQSVKDDDARASGKGKAVAAAKSKMPAESPPLSHLEIRAIVIGIMLAMFLGALDQTIVATALPTIGLAFGEVENLSWVVTAYLLTATAVTPLYGKLSDIYGRRRVLLAGIVIFIVGSAACALAPSMTALIFFRALQGIGGGGLMSLAQTIIGDIVSPRERGRYQGYIGTVFAIASIGGPLLGGTLAQHLHWSLIFWINIPIGLAALAMTHRTLIRLPRHERPHKLDVLGAILMMAAAIALMLALTWGGTRYPWISAPIGALLLGSTLLWAVFSWRLMTAREPFLPIAILKNPVVRAGTLAGACTMGTMVGLTIFVPLYFEVVAHLSASQSGLALIPLMTAVVVASTLTGHAMVHMERYKRMPLVGLSVSILCLGALAIWPSGLPLALVIALLAGSGFGIGTVYPVSTVSVQNAVARPQLGTVTGTMNFFRLLGSALVVALLGAIVLGGIGGGAGVSLEVLAKSAANVDLANVFRFVFLAAALVLGFALAFLIAMEERALRGPVTAKQTTPASLITPEPRE